MTNPIAEYLKELEKQLRFKGLFDDELLMEIESHLLDSVDANLNRGLDQAAAEKEALRRFGSAEVVASTFESEWLSPMQKAFIVIALVSGLVITYVDSRPSWDDTGITAGVILLVCGLIALLGFRRPWVLALAVGAWIPLYALFVTHNYGSIIALMIAFVGAYAGWLCRAAIVKSLTLLKG